MYVACNCFDRTIQDPASQRLTWYKTPMTVLVVKKVRDSTVLQPFVELVKWLIVVNYDLVFSYQSFFISNFSYLAGVGEDLAICYLFVFWAVILNCYGLSDLNWSITISGLCLPFLGRRRRRGEWIWKFLSLSSWPLYPHFLKFNFLWRGEGFSISEGLVPVSPSKFTCIYAYNFIACLCGTCNYTSPVFKISFLDLLCSSFFFDFFFSCEYMYLRFQAPLATVIWWLKMCHCWWIEGRIQKKEEKWKNNGNSFTVTQF